MDETTTEGRTLADEDIVTISPGAASAETERPGDEDMQDADGTDTEDTKDQDATDSKDQDATDSKDQDATDSKDADATDQAS